MAVNEAKDGIIESELNHDTTLPAIANHVLRDVIFAGVAHEATILLLDEEGEEDLTLAHILHLLVLFAQVVAHQVDFILFLFAALLPTKSNDVVSVVVGEQRLEVDLLWNPRMIPGYD